MSSPNTVSINADQNRDRFNNDWLSLREHADHRARARDLTRKLTEWSPAERWQVLDLAAGQGSNTRYLAPGLPGPQHWTLLDHDPDLLAAAETRCAGLTTSSGDAVSVSTHAVDLRDMEPGWHPDWLPSFNLVTAAALIDLVSMAWLQRFTAWVVAYNQPLLVALSYSGQIRFQPALEGDLWLQNQVNRHQFGHGAFGPNLGPSAVAALQKLLQNMGYQVSLVASPWQLSAAERPLQQALVNGWTEAVRELGASEATQADQWQRRAEARIGDGCDITVGHFDLLALPPRPA